MAGNAVGLTSLRHALTDSVLECLIASHGHFFPAGPPASARHGE
jgi:hypothetical protein